MSSDPLQDVLGQLCQGDLDAAERVFRAYEPYLRLVVRRQLPAQMRAKFDSIDVVQSVWVDLLQGFREAGWHFVSVAQLRAFLITATRNRFIDRVRQHGSALSHEQDAFTDGVEFVPSQQPAPSEEAQASELWEQMLALCPPDHRQVLEMRKQGFSLDEIAAGTGLHEGSVRRILRTLARQLAFPGQPAAEHGES